MLREGECQARTTDTRGGQPALFLHRSTRCSNWRLIPKNAGLQICGKSCRIRWTKYLRLDLKHGQFSPTEEETIMKLHAVVGNRRSLNAAQLSGRTDNDVKNHWNTKLKKKPTGMGIDPVTHKSFSHLMAEIATTLGPPQVANLSEAARGCFKDEMLHLLTKKRIDFQVSQPTASQGNNNGHYVMNKSEGKEDTVEKIKLGLSRAIQQPDMMNQPWETNVAASNRPNGACNTFATFQYGPPFGRENNGSPWSQSMCTGSTSTAGDPLGHLKLEDENGEESEAVKEIRNGTSIFNTDCVLWDLPSDELMNPMV